MQCNAMQQQQQQKAGGGSIGDRRNELNFEFKYGQDHPHPKKLETYKKYESLIISLRDPIERMKSGWYWRALLQCRYDRKDEIRKKNCKNRGQHPDKCCDNKKSKTIIGYLNRYDGHAYNLAEAFCSNDTSIQKQAYIDINEIPHLGHTIVNWLHLINNNNNNNSNSSSDNYDYDYNYNYNDDAIKIIQNKMIPVIVEKGYDLIEQIDGAIEWLLNITFDGDEEMASNVFNKAKQEYETHHKSNTSTRSNKKLHSSKMETFPWLKEVTSITTIGSCCLARHFYKDDYLLLLNPKFPNWLCNKGKTKTKQLCYNAILSIIERKRNMLEYALYSNKSCNDIDIDIDIDSTMIINNVVDKNNDNHIDNDNGKNNINTNSYIEGGGGGGGGGEKNEIFVQLSSAVKTPERIAMMTTLFGLLVVLIIYYITRKRKKKYMLFEDAFKTLRAKHTSRGTSS
jgi:hypothetical protein